MSVQAAVVTSDQLGSEIFQRRRFLRLIFQMNALALAQENAAMLNLKDTGFQFPGKAICSKNVEGAFDLIVANLPYVSTQEPTYSFALKYCTISGSCTVRRKNEAMSWCAN